VTRNTLTLDFFLSLIVPVYFLHTHSEKESPIPFFLMLSDFRAHTASYSPRPVTLSKGQSGWSVKLNTHLRLAPAWRAPETSSPFTFTSIWHFLVGKPEGKRPLGRPRRRWVDNIRTDLQEVGCGYMDWIGLAQDRDRWRTLVSAVMNLRVP